MRTCNGRNDKLTRLIFPVSFPLLLAANEKRFGDPGKKKKEVPFALKRRLNHWLIK
jgi:hypothetical protein